MTSVGKWRPNQIRKRRLDGTWVDATPQRAIVSASPAPAVTRTEYTGWIVFTFTGSGTVSFSGDFGGTGQALIVAGGAAGSAGFATGIDAYFSRETGGTGGSGGRVHVSPLAVSANTPIPVTVGGAGTASTVGPISSASGQAGGSGGLGAGGFPLRPSAQPGSAGISNNYRFGSNEFYGGGGGGGGTGSYFAGPMAFFGTPVGSGGAGGGGSGGSAGTQIAYAGSPGVANTGGGGGGGGAENTGSGIGQNIKSGAGGAGGSGIVVLRFPTSEFRTS